MKHYKMIADGYIVLVGIDCGGGEITEQEYNAIMDAIRSKPSAPHGCDYKLKADLQWELYELPPVEDEELTAEEALDIIVGGTA